MGSEKALDLLGKIEARLFKRSKGLPQIKGNVVKVSALDKVYGAGQLKVRSGGIGLKGREAFSKDSSREGSLGKYGSGYRFSGQIGSTVSNPLFTFKKRELERASERLDLLERGEIDLVFGDFVNAEENSYGSRKSVQLATKPQVSSDTVEGEDEKASGSEIPLLFTTGRKPVPYRSEGEKSRSEGKKDEVERVIKRFDRDALVSRELTQEAYERVRSLQASKNPKVSGVVYAEPTDLTSGSEGISSSESEPTEKARRYNTVKYAKNKGNYRTGLDPVTVPYQKEPVIIYYDGAGDKSRWLGMPREFHGIVLYEHSTSYISKDRYGIRKMYRKLDNELI